MSAPRSLVRLAVGVITAVSVMTTAAAPPANASPDDPGLRTKIRSVLRDTRVAQGRTGAIVLDASDGRELVKRHAGWGIIPASNTKIATAVTAMHTLGPGYRFKTEVIRRGRVSSGTLSGNLYLKGYGDPTLRRSDLKKLAGRVHDAGIRTVTGALVADSSFFDNVGYNRTWNTSYADDYYAAKVSGLTLAPDADYDAGTVRINYAPGSAAGKPARISFTPKAARSYLRVSNKATTGKRGTRVTFAASRTYGSATIKLRGKVPRGRSTGHTLITVARPDLYAATVFRAELTRAGVAVRGTTKARATPAGHRTVIARDTSMTLSKLLVPFLKLSNNTHAEALTKAMGTLQGRPGNWADGLSYTRAYLKHLGAPMKHVRLHDGSGLSRGNRLTARGLARVLYRVQRAPWFDAFYAALPVAGNTKRMVGGTLRHRMNGTRAADNARAKTGTLTGVTALSGYVRGRDGRRYVFSMLSNYSGTSPRPVEDEFVRTLAARRR
ncbi:D-alanyl-D-alanine carboxypeptidase/D-alanyl-D-alanine-endopeptidase [Microlunatus sp. Gsoil 973]|uniref:D-alanyl-D-alanine carboxypeptidase/D-alanyl-D-alanine endopeptidase n=1 Tax=Microlunatus sp. Gsoil 973 TaxID=2672569 RepID=UPI0012B4BE15|nr:D-alanyl-D-alanine carboxypeptidase/D-alanyl-D-alanine-endopeptidase [Microlunatus sp. Gsoil 973]QGN33641.1 D-alanyl-D-alanine carboxypeptidase/D-alanyl-D-alanine-endopeptidase [Microlunatus sp. Gsoil 973]